MLITLPPGLSTFADSTRTEGPQRKYVLAQFRSDMDLTWVSSLRAELGVDEVKYKHFVERRPRLKMNRGLWEQIEAGVFRATVVIIDPEPVCSSARRAFLDEGAEEGYDFGQREVNDRSATALVAATPVAYLPSELSKALGYRSRTLFPPESFAPRAIQACIGTTLSKATIFAARAHAMFDTAIDDPVLSTTADVYKSPLAKSILRDVAATGHVFDVEHAASAEVLNDASAEIAAALSNSAGPYASPTVVMDSTEVYFAGWSSCFDHWTGDSCCAPERPRLVREENSHAIDHLQGADVAAGWAREMLDTGHDVRAVANKFDRVCLNGQIFSSSRNER